MRDFDASVRGSSLWLIARLGITLTVGALVTTFIIRSLSVKDFGVYNVLFSLIGYVGVIGSFGIPAVFQRFIPEALQRAEYSHLKRLVVRGLVLRLCLSAATVGAILLLNGPVGRLLKLDEFMAYFSIFAVGIVMSLEASLLTSVLHSLFLHKYSVIASTVHTVFRGACVFAFLKMGWGLRGILWAEVASWGVWTLIQLVFYHVKFARLHTVAVAEPSFPVWRYLRYGGFSLFSEAGSAVLGVSMDFFVITAVLGPGAVAFYAFANRVVRMFLNCMPHLVLIDVIRPSFFAKYAESGNKRHLSEMFNLLVKIGAFCVFPLAAGLFVLGDNLITVVFKPEYLGAKPILWVTVAFAGVNIFAQPTGLVLKATEQVQVILYSRVFAVYNLLVELIVVQWFGVMGVVLVTCSANLMTNLFLYSFARKNANLRVHWRGLCTIAVNSALMALAIWPLRGYATSFASLALIAGVGAAVYLLSGWINKAFSDQERGWVNRVAPRPMFVF